MTAANATAEKAVRAACAAGDLDRATTLALRAYGGEVYGLLAALHRAEDEADDAFAAFSEKLWRTLGRFAWDCSLRSWVYLLARHASRDVRRGEGRRRKREQPLGPGSEIEAVAAAVRTETATFLRTETKTAMQRVREELPEEDQLLLVLRIDRGLPWDELVPIFLEQAEGAERGSPLPADVRKRESARLRKRMEAVKKRVVALAVARGLLDR